MSSFFPKWLYHFKVQLAVDGSYSCTTSILSHSKVSHFQLRMWKYLNVLLRFSQLWCWRRLLRVPWTATRSNQSILKEISPEYSSEGLMLKLKLQYSGHLIGRANSLEKTLILGKIKSKRRKGWRRMWWFTINPMDMSLSKLWEWRPGKPGMLQSMGWQTVGPDLVTEQQQTPTKGFSLIVGCFRMREVFVLKEYINGCAAVIHILGVDREP